MGLFTEKYNTPFDNEQMRKPVDEKITALHVRPTKYLSTRASLLLGYTLVSLCIEFLIPGNVIWWPIACSFVCLFVWAITFRFFMPRNLSVVTFAIVMAGFIALSEYSSRFGFCAPYAAAGFIPMALGIMSVARFKPDDEEIFSRPRFGGEVMFPYSLALISSVVGSLITYVFEKRYLFVSLLAAVMFLIVLSWAVSKISGGTRCATSKTLTEFWDIPVANVSALRRFLSARGEFAIVILLCTAALYILRLFIDAELFKIVAIPACVFVALLTGSIFVYTAKHNFRSSIFGLRYLISEVSIASAFISTVFLVSSDLPKIRHLAFALVLVISTDIIITGLLSVIRRRLIFVSKSKYIDGLPFYLILISLVVMLAETCLYSIPGL